MWRKKKKYIKYKYIKFDIKDIIIGVRRLQRQTRLEKPNLKCFINFSPLKKCGKKIITCLKKNY